MLQTIFTKISYSMILLLTIFVAADYSYASAGKNGATVFTVDDDDDDDRKRGRRGGRDNKRGDSQRGSDRESKRQQRDSDRESRRQQWESDRRSRDQQQRSDGESRRQQWESDRRSREQQQRSDWNSRRQQRESDRRSRDNNRDYRVYQDNRRDNRRVIYKSPQGFWNQIWNGGAARNINRNVYRQDQGRYEREQRKYQKKQLKAEQRYARNQQHYYNQNVYNNYPQAYYGGGYDNGYQNDILGGGGGSGWKDLILRSVIANVLGGGGGGLDLGNIIPNQRYAQNTPANYGYEPVYNGYSQPYYSPAPVNYGYYDQPQYDSPFGGGLLNSLPIAEIVSQYTGDNEFVSGLVGMFLTQGYDQGYLAGQGAREYGYEDANYNDPYTYQNGSCDPYSTTIGENRRYLSEGYNLGYRDAIAGNTGYDPDTEGNVDLVGALLNNVLSGI